MPPGLRNAVGMYSRASGTLTRLVGAYFTWML
jgi:hypothetical protein